MSLKENCTLIFVLPNKKNKTCFAQQLSISALYKSNGGSFFMEKRQIQRVPIQTSTGRTSF